MSLETLFLPLAQSNIKLADDARVLVMGAKSCDALTPDMNLWQAFKPYADVIEARGLTVNNDLDDACTDESYDAVFINAPQNQIETKYLIARALKSLKTGGMLIASAANGAGGKRLQKTFESFNIDRVQNVSKNKARCVWSQKSTNFDDNSEIMGKAIDDGQFIDILDGAYRSQAGIFGWDKMDKGSAILIENLPETFKGRGADFGCGYGALSRAIIKRVAEGEKFKSLICIDADARAVKLCEENVDDPRASYLWRDLTKDSGLKNLDFIVMNPPFHAGKITDSDIGIAFIRNARAALKPRNGNLYMVANAQLPYEPILNKLFFKVNKLHEGGGFKVYQAVT